MSKESLNSKKQLVDEISQKIADSSSSVIVEYRGLTVAQTTELRASLREEDIEFHVYKNTMTRRAVEKAGYDELQEVLVGPNAMAFGPDAVAPSRILAEFAKKHKKLKFKAGIVDGKVVDVDQLEQLSKLPNKDGMLSMLLGTLKAPMGSVARVLAAVAESKEEGDATEASAE